MKLYFDPKQRHITCPASISKPTNYNLDHLMPQLCVCEDEAKEDEVGEKGDDADDQDGQTDP